MNPWPFVIAAYALVILGTAGAGLFAWHAMRTAEAAADALRKRP